MAEDMARSTKGGRSVSKPHDCLSTARETAREKLATLTLEEKVSLLTAADFWRTKAIIDKGIKSIKTTDGPNGARGERFVGGKKAALFPCGVSLAATWNKKLAYRIGEELAGEAKAKAAQLLLAPTVCMHRHPLGGRNFESFSEDPLLTGKIASEYIKGLQASGIAASIKHFVGNEQETNRMTVDSIVDERALREIYLRPFEIAIREANPWTVMTSYNKVNGIHADMNHYLLQDILRQEWQYDGTVISDWSAINSTVESVEAGCDLEFPFSDKWRLDKLTAAVDEERIDRRYIDRAAENILTLIERIPAESFADGVEEHEDDRQETRDLIRVAGQEGLTLLKNETKILPICPQTVKIAVIGVNANRAVAGGGGSASLNPYYTTTPLDSIRSVAQTVIFAQGCHSYKNLPVASPFCTDSAGNRGMTIQWFAGDKFQGSPKVVQNRPNSDLFLWDSAPKEVGPEWSAIVNATLVPTSSGKHTISFMSVGPGRLYLNGEVVSDLWDWEEEGDAMFEGSSDELVEVVARANEEITIRIELTNELRPARKQELLGVSHRYGGCRVGFRQQDDTDYLQEAVDAAKASDVAIVIGGLDPEWESEGYDRRNMDLPLNGSQDKLIEAIVQANPNTVVVNQSGTPIHMPWADKVPAIIQAWYQGQEAGNALADVLFGLANPGGKLPVTFPKRIEHAPAWRSWPGENLQAVYEEGIFIGYRHYERANVRPLFPFGHGLSYTTFTYTKPQISPDVLEVNGVVRLSLVISNTGSRSGAEIVQFYVKHVSPRLSRPAKELVAFEKIFLELGESKTVETILDKHAVGYYDDQNRSWIAEKGDFDVLIGASSVDIRHSLSLKVKESFSWIF